SHHTPAPGSTVRTGRPRNVVRAPRTALKPPWALPEMRAMSGARRYIPHSRGRGPPRVHVRWHPANPADSHRELARRDNRIGTGPGAAQIRTLRALTDRCLTPACS